MPRRIFFMIAMLTIPLIILAGCASSQQNDQQTIYVGPIQVECEGVTPQLCLLIKNNPTDNYEYFYDQIEGFDFEPGSIYELQVSEEQIENPPADAPSRRLTLVEIVSQEPVNSQLDGSFWELQNYRDETGASVNVLPETQINAKFNAIEIGGNAGCNTYFGSYTLDGERIYIGLLASTEIFCDTPAGIMEQESNYLAALSDAHSFQMDEDELQFFDSGGNLILTYQRVDPTPLVGTNWVLTGYNNGMGGFVSLIGGTHIDAFFDEDGMLSGTGGCNRYTASYQASENQISIDQPDSTRMFCGSPEGTMIQENAYLSALSTAQTYQIQANQLIILAENNELALAFIASQDPVQETRLEETVWMWQSSQYGDGSVATPEESDNYTLEFLPENLISVVADCNMATGSYYVDGSSLSFEVVTATQAACPTGSLSEQFIEDLNAAAIYFFQDESLFIDMLFDRGTMRFSPSE